jgi:hypothetical protein
MFLFLRLLLGHFLGDFPFQFNSIFKLKLKGFFGIIPHVLIILACCIALSWPYLTEPSLWLFILFIGITHLIQDWVKIKYGSIKCSFWPYVADQIFHAATIAVVLLTPLKNLPAPGGDNFLVRLYNNDQLVKYLIAVIAATYNGYFMIRCFKDSFIGRANCNAFEKWYGIAERAMIVSCFALGGFWFLLLPVILFLRPPVFSLAAKRFLLHADFKALQDTLLSWTLALGAALLLYLL